MNKSRRLLIFLLLMGSLLLLALLFPQFFLANLILPVATVLWLLLRIFVLSIDQQIYWWLLIFLVIFLALLRFFLRPETINPYQPPEQNQTLDSVHRWRMSILSNVYESGENNALKRELMWLLTAMYSTRQQTGANFEIKEALEQHQIPLPEHVYTFLFSKEPEKPRQTFLQNPLRYFKQIAHSIRLAVHKKIRKWTGRELADYYQAIDEVLSLMETTMENKYNDDPISPHNND